MQPISQLRRQQTELLFSALPVSESEMFEMFGRATFVSVDIAK